MPSVSVAFGDIIILSLAVVDGQVQCLDAFTTLGSSGVVSVCA